MNRLNVQVVLMPMVLFSEYSVRVMLDKIQHIRSLVGLDNVIPLPKEDIPSFSDSTRKLFEICTDSQISNVKSFITEVFHI